MASSGASCIYCDRPADSEEHIFGSWFIRELESARGGLITGARFDQGDKITPIFVSRNSKGKRQLDFTTDLICHRCNSEWMNRIDESVHRYMTGMIRGRTTVINGNARRAMASWAVKTAITARFAHINPDPVEGNWPKQLLRDKKPSSEWSVWLSRYTGNRGFWYRQGEIAINGAKLIMSTSKQDPVDPPLSKGGAVMTIVIGELCAQVLRLNGPEQTIDLGDPVALRIWPSGFDAEWPPADQLDDGNLKQFSERFASAGLGIVRQLPTESTGENDGSQRVGLFSSSRITEESLLSPENFALALSVKCGKCQTEYSFTHDAGKRLVEMEFPYSVTVEHACPGCDNKGLWDLQFASLPNQWRSP